MIQRTVEELVALIQPPLSPISDANGIIHDETMVAARCLKGHVHKYPFIEIGAGGLSVCKTCSFGGLSNNLVREYVEKTLGAPFVYDATRSNLTDTWYTCAQLKCAVCSVAYYGQDTECWTQDGYFCMKIHKTQTTRSVHTALCKYLDSVKLAAMFGDKIPAALVAQEEPKKKKRVTKMRCGALPYTPAMAREHIMTMPDPTTAQHQIYIVDAPWLLFENNGSGSYKA